jgi:outer membrane receptor protein involved in Fe transport
MGYTGTNGLRADGSSLPNTGNNFAAFLVGAVSSVSYNRRIMSNLPRTWQNSFYIQDDWKITPSLMLNIGVRYSLETPPSQKYGQISIFDPNIVVDSVYTNYTCPAGTRAPGRTRGGAATASTNNWDPRIGLAWNPARNWCRTGFAMTHVDMRTGFSPVLTESTSRATALG